MPRILLARVAMTAVLILACSPAASAKGKAKARKNKQVATLLLPVKVKGLEVDVAKRLGRVMARTVVDEMRDLRVLRLLGGKTVKAKVKRLKKNKVLVSDCHEKKKCIKAVGRQVRARVLYYAELSDAPKGVKVAIHALDVRSGKEVRAESEFAKAEEDDVARATRWAVRKATSPLITTMLKGKGRLLVSCQQADAVLFINGKSFGKRTNKGFKVGAGVFDLQVKKDGFVSYHDVVVVKPGEELKVKAVLTQKSRPVAAVVAAVGKPDEKPKNAGKAELPAWAVFEKKPKATGKTDAGAATRPKLATGSEQVTPKPFLPVDEQSKPQPTKRPDRVDDGDQWYETWWFWTVVGVVAVGGVGGGLYAGGVFDSGGGSGSTGSALISWQ